MSGFTSIFGSSGADKSGSSGLTTSTSAATNAQVKRQIQEQLAQELAIANATELVNVCRDRVVSSRSLKF
jgi:hypothetical protein